jgi:hypothetical protein
MANFMKTFRKNRKLMFAFLTVMCMFAFVFLGSVGYDSSRGRQANPIAVTTAKYGSLKQRPVG